MLSPRRARMSIRRSLAALSILLLTAGCPAVSAQTPGATDGSAAEEAAAGVSRETVFSLILKGRWIMIPIGLCSVVVVTAAIERALSLRGARVATAGVLDALFDVLPSREDATSEELSSARELTDDESKPIDRLLRAGVVKLSRDESHAQTALEDAAARELHLLTRKLRPFSIVAAICPLLGLLGTIYGMITCFEQAASADAAARTETLASGIYVALVSTAAGLTVAIPAMVLNFWYQGRVDRIADQMEDTATQFLDHYYARDDLSPRELKSGRRQQPREKPAEAGA